MSPQRSLLRSLAPVVVLACAALAWPAGSLAAAPCQNDTIVPTPANLTKARGATLCLINRERTSRGRSPLRSSSRLLNPAESYSGLMVSAGFFSHVSPNGSTPTSRVRSQTTYLRGARSWTLGENIAWGAGVLATPASTLAMWMNSPGHRANILSRRFRNVGIGIVTGTPYPTNGSPAATYTAVFGRSS